MTSPYPTTSASDDGEILDARSAYSAPPLSDAAMRALMRLANLQLTPRMLTSLLDHFGWDAERIFEASDDELDSVPNLNGRQAVRIRDDSLDVTERQLRWMEKTGSRILLANRPDFPAQLLEIPDLPPMLFVRGSIQPRDESGVGIVGSRQASPYGLAVADRFAQDLAQNGVTVISGGAIGIDTAAHSGALRAGGRTIAILGCGIDVDYPRVNHDLFEQIVDGNGAIVSEYALGSPPDSFRFPQRNRLISGLSLGTLVVEAPRQSGSLITARFAAEQGRPVLTVPANIDRPNSTGSNDLLKDGAIPVTETADILLALRLMPSAVRKPQQFAMRFDAETEASAPIVASGPSKDDIERVIRNLPEAQKLLLLNLSETPSRLDTLAELSGSSASSASAELTMLEIGGYVRRLPGNCFILVSERFRAQRS